MANASPAAARAGWQIFKSYGFDLSLDMINERLGAAGFEAISRRMRNHYRNLAAAGYDHYISINRFDVARAAMRYEGRAADSRYLYRSTNVAVRVTFVRVDKFFEAYGQAKEISEVGAILEFPDPQVSQSVANSKLAVGDSLLLSFLDPPGSSAARVVEVDKRNVSKVQLEIEYTRLQSIVEFTGQDALPTSEFTIRLVPVDAEENSADVIGRRIFYLFESVDACRAAINAALWGDEEGRYAEPVRLESLKVESPIEAVMFLPPTLVSVYLVVRGAIDLYSRAQKARLAQHDADFRSEEVKGKRLENRISEIRVEVLDRMQDGLGTVGLSEEDRRRVEMIIVRKAFASMSNLAEQGVKDVDVETSSG